MIELNRLTGNGSSLVDEKERPSGRFVPETATYGAA
jgi:hypothetical protein